GGSDVLGGKAVADRYLIEPAAPWFACWAVETGDIRFEIDDRRSLDKVNTGELDGRAVHVEDADEAEPDGVDPFWPPGGEDAFCALLASQQERNVPERWLAAGLVQPVQPGHEPVALDLGHPVHALVVVVRGL